LAAGAFEKLGTKVIAEKETSTRGERTSELGGAGKRSGDLTRPSLRALREELESELEEDMITQTSEN
jgi:hypothetical protein